MKMVLNRRRMVLAMSCVSVVALASSQALADSEFTGTGDLPGGDDYSQPYGISGDGQTVVGWSGETVDYLAFRWTPGGGIESLGDLAGGSFFGEAFDANFDGSVIVGDADSVSGSQAFRRPFAGHRLGAWPELAIFPAEHSAVAPALLTQMDRLLLAAAGQSMAWRLFGGPMPEA